MVETCFSWFYILQTHPLTFTIGWLKLLNLRFNLEKTISLTFTIGWLKLLFIISTNSTRSHFNFHHRVVETAAISIPTKYGISFNFHHRVVETSAFIIWPNILLFALTFTIGWLKQITIHLKERIDWTLTFTIGWLKLL